MIEEDDTTTETHHLGLQGRVISDQYRRSIENLRRLVNEFDAVTKLAEPEILDGRRFGMSVADNGPTFPLPAWHAIKQDPEVVTERRNQFWDHGRYVTQRFPMECDGHRSTLVLTPIPGVPRIKTWGAYGNGRHGIVDIRPTLGNFIVGTEEEDDVPVLLSESQRAIERRYAGG